MHDQSDDCNRKKDLETLIAVSSNLAGSIQWQVNFVLYLCTLVYIGSIYC